MAAFETEGDTESSLGNHEEAINRYSVALSLDPTAHCLLLKRSKARALKTQWEDALKDANKVRSSFTAQFSVLSRTYQAVELDPSSPWGYEQKRAVLHSVGCYAEAIDAQTSMFLILEQSPDPDIRSTYTFD